MAGVDCSGLAPYEKQDIRDARYRYAEKVKLAVLEYDESMTFRSPVDEKLAKMVLRFETPNEFSTKDLEKFIYKRTRIHVDCGFRYLHQSSQIQLEVAIDNSIIFGKCCTRYSICQWMQLVLCLALFIGVIYVGFIHPYLKRHHHDFPRRF